MTENNSRDCPFCGDIGELDEVGAGSQPAYVVICNGCGAFGPPGKTPLEASAAWDARITTTTPEER
jgi:uncharacterized Zn finger protein